MNEEIHLRDYLRVINKRRSLVMSFFIVTLVLVVLGTLAATPQYEGSTQVMIEKVANSNLTDGGRFNSYDPEFYETQFQLIKSQAVARRVIEMLHLDNDSVGTVSGLREGRESLIVSADSKVSESRHLGDLMAENLTEEISVVPVKNSRLVDISFLSPNPDFAAMIANTVAKAYIEQSLNMKMDATRRTLEWMTTKADEERKKLRIKEEEVQAYMRANNLVTVENRIAVLPQKLAEISTALVRAETRRKEKQELYQRVSKVSNDPVAAEAILGLTKNSTLQILRDEILKAEQKIRELSAKYGVKHPVMVKAQGDLEILISKKREEITRLIEGAKNEYEFARASEENLRAQMDRTKAEAHNLNEKSIQYDALKREMETSRQLYDALMLRMNEQNITGETDPVNLWIVQKALVPLKPVKPRKKVNLLLGLVVGLFGGIGLAFFVEYLDNTIKYPEETEKILGLPTLGLVSLWKEKDTDIDRAVLDQPRSAFSESYKALLTAVMLSSAEGLPGRILITSSVAGAGKTTTALNLAVSLAQTGKRVILVDADMRKPRIHKALKLANNAGLSNWLAGGEGKGLVQEGPIKNLSVITSGPIPPNPSELLSGQRMDKMLEKLEQSYDVIICDSPPLLSVADGRILSRVVNGTIMVVRAKLTTYELAHKAIKMLRDVNGTILGTVINALDLKKNDHYYQYYYGSYGTYGDEVEEGGFDIRGEEGDRRAPESDRRGLSDV